jgi:predicted phage terminase large subunit-like protein
MTTQSIPREELAKAELARRDFKYFCNYVHDVKLARHMMKWVAILQSEKVEDKKVAISAAPEFWKSRVIRMWIEYSIGQNPEWARCLAMNTEKQAAKQVMSVEETIATNIRYQLVFPHVKPDTRRGWNQTQMFVTRKNSARPEPTLMGCGVEGPVQGMHFEEIFTDDLTDQQDVRSDTTMNSQREWLKGVMSDRLRTDKDDVPIGRWFAILTRWSESDLWPLYTQHPDPDNEQDGGMGFKAIQMPAVDPDTGEANWPEEYPLTRLDGIRRRKGNSLYTMTFLCDPSAMGGNVFDTSKVGRYSLSRPPDFTYRIHSWDFASGESADASWTVMTEWSVGPMGYYLTWVERSRRRYGELLPLLYDLRDDRRPNVVLIEDRGLGQSVIRDLQVDSSLWELRTVDPMGKGDKFTRAVGHTGLIETGKIFVPETAPYLSDFMAEMSGFPNARFDDQVDSMSQAWDYLRFNVRNTRPRPNSWMKTRPLQPTGAPLMPEDREYDWDDR